MAAEHTPKSTTSRVNPLLRTQRETRQEPDICHVWTKHSPEDLCSKGRWPRLRLMRQISLFTTDCASEDSNVQLGELFRLEWATLKSESDLLSHTEHLRPGAQGRDCILGSARSDSCLRCFRRLDESLTEVNRAFGAFNNALRRFDCTVASDSSTATRPFSPNGTCLDCKTWYRKWLLVQLVNVWEEPPCINWCYYTQLACPYLAPSKVAEFAGHPAFQCRDLQIPRSKAEHERVLNRDGASSCSCIHPCDLSRTDEPPPNLSSMPQSLMIADPSAPKPYDFFAAMEHCWARRKRCREEREMAAAIEHARVKVTKFEPNANHFTRLAGYVDDAPDELYNQLVSPPHPLRRESIAPELGQRDLELFGSEPAAAADDEHDKRPRRRSHRYATSTGPSRFTWSQMAVLLSWNALFALPMQ